MRSLVPAPAPAVAVPSAACRTRAGSAGVRGAVDQRALLVLWSAAPFGEQEGREFASLRDALAAAEALRGADRAAEERPWIITEDGTILTPLWIEAALAARAPTAPPRAR